jgi:hypothetical protein|eukprot:SAG25_NODE_519_length_7241_cov_159.775553_6_plen_70_part_00
MEMYVYMHVVGNVCLYAYCRHRARQCGWGLTGTLHTQRHAQTWDDDRNGVLDYYEVEACVQKAFSEEMR